MKERLEQLIQNIEGQFVEVSYRPAGYQCMDLAYLWVFALGFPKETIQNGYAFQVWANPKPITRDYFDFITNTPDAVPQAGDLVVWNANVGGGAGHIAIATGTGGTERFESLDQNWPVNSEVAIRRHDYSNVYGWLRPKKEKLETVKQIVKDEIAKVDFGGFETPLETYNVIELSVLKSKILAKDQRIEELEDRPVEVIEAPAPQFSNPLAKVLFGIAKALG